ncbi:MAG: hypothetical protein HYY84_19245 [Deltaproteobacteria bacterium]|nr:hypothetical protein [Deltaproteobacteria bacterium]
MEARESESPLRFVAAEACRDFDREHPEGASCQAILEFFGARGVALSEATFRRYVKLGLVPRSVRVGRKGKHRGSSGLYPVGTATQVNDIRRLTHGDVTIEDLVNSHFLFQKEIAAAGRQLDAIFDAMVASIASAPTSARSRAELANEERALRKLSRDVLKRLGALGTRISPLRPSGVDE